MRVLLVSPLPPPAGGIAVWTRQYMKKMKEMGHSVDLVNISVIGGRAVNYTKSRLLEELCRTIKILGQSFFLLAKNTYDIVHLNTSCSNKGILRDKLILNIAHLFGKKVLLHCHCNVASSMRGEKKKKIFAKMLAKSSLCLVLNGVSAEFLQEKFHTESIVMPNFIDYECLAEADGQKDIKPDIERVLFVGHLLKTKGCDNIIEAAKDFPEIEFRLVGHISQSIGTLERPQNVVLIGEKSYEDVCTEYRNADVFVFPTHTEGFPLAIVEAMAYGLPIVTTRVGAIPDMLKDEGALYVNINHCEDLKKALLEIKDVDLRKKMSAFNQKRAKDEYDIENVINRLVGVYREIK